MSYSGEVPVVPRLSVVVITLFAISCKTMSNPSRHGVCHDRCRGWKAPWPLFHVLSSGRTSCEDRRDTCSLVRLNPTLFVRIATPTRDLTSLDSTIHDYPY